MEGSKEKIGKIRPMEDPRIKAAEEKLDKLIESSQELQRLTRVIHVIHSPLYKSEQLLGDIKRWNESVKDWGGGYVEKKYKAQGGVLKIQMDYRGNVRIMWGVEELEPYLGR